mgnify:FL=1
MFNHDNLLDLLSNLLKYQPFTVSISYLTIEACLRPIIIYCA